MRNEVLRKIEIEKRNKDLNGQTEAAETPKISTVLPALVKTRSKKVDEQKASPRLRQTQSPEISKKIVSTTTVRKAKFIVHEDRDTAS